MENVYDKNFNISQLPAASKRNYMKHTFTSFPVAAVIILHIITLGIFSTIYYGLKHSQMPKIRENDFGAGRAIGFLFIPFFNFYWLFVFWLRLADRINFQLRLRGEETFPKALTIVLCIFTLATIIPLAGIIFGLINWFVIGPVTVGLLQHSINKLAAS